MLSRVAVFLKILTKIIPLNQESSDFQLCLLFGLGWGFGGFFVVAVIFFFVTATL